MGRTLFCDCCGQDIRVGNDLYRVDKIPISIRNERDMFKALEKATKVTNYEPYIVCSSCFREIGRKIQDRNNPIEFDVSVETEDK